VLESAGTELENLPHHTGLLQDLSAGGCRILLDASRDPQLQEGDTVRIRFQPDPRSVPLSVDAMFRHSDPMPQRRVTLGFQFVGLELTAEGRETLQAMARVVSTFLRIDNRRQQRRQVTRNPRRKAT
jgi:hypothetical protein